MIERIHLAILNEIDKKGTLTAAAESLCLTQPALTHAIRKLEARIGTPLWQKDGRGLRLTRAGRYLLALSKRILPQLALAEEKLSQYAQGRRGMLCIGMECHPCYRWLLDIVSQYLTAWPDVEIDVKREFQFDGIKALADFDIDLLITPDPVSSRGLLFTPVFEYEQVLAVPAAHPLAEQDHVTAEQLTDEVLITYPVPLDRLDIYTGFLIPARCRPKHHKTIETTDIMLQMVASGRGVTALPRWLVADYEERLRLKSVRIGAQGIWKEICVGVRCEDERIDYIRGFLQIAGG